MGILTREQTGKRFVLHAETVIGRSSRSCTLVLSDPAVSGSHAKILWQHGTWLLRDLNSRNGTTLNGLSITQETPLTEGARLTFGSGADTWILTSAQPPTIHAQTLDGSLLTNGAGDLLILPSEDEPEVTIYRQEDEGWIAEGKDSAQRVSDGDEILAGGQVWRLTLPVLRTRTIEIDNLPPLVQNLRLQFLVTLDEEHIKLLVWHEDSLLSELRERTHHHILLLLARRRLKDMRDDLPPSAQGWMKQNDLLPILGIDLKTFNVQIFRIRQQFSELPIEDAANIIERRPSNRQLRIGASLLEILVT